MATIPNTNHTVGKALYLELRRGRVTDQVLITPEGISETGRYVPMATYRRRVSESAPRKSWKQQCTLFRSEIHPDTNQLVQLGAEYALATVKDRVGYMTGLFEQLVSLGYTVYRQPLAIEITPKDLDDVAKGKVPYSAMHRLNQSRLAAGFSAQVFEVA